MICPECNQQIDYGRFEGGTLTDRMFEDVWFRVSHDGTNYSVEVESRYSKYFEQFNADYWYGAALDSLNSRKFEVLCPKCKEEFNLNPDGSSSKMVWIPLHQGVTMSMDEFIEELRSKSNGKPITLNKLNELVDGFEDDR